MSCRVTAKIILETGDAPPQLHRPSLVADPISLRGLPMIGRGVQGAVRATRLGDSLR